MAPAHAIDGPDAHDHATKQLAPELTIDGPQQDGYSPITAPDISVDSRFWRRLAFPSPAHLAHTDRQVRQFIESMNLLKSTVFIADAL